MAKSSGTGATFTLSAFGDEIDADLNAQLELLSELDIGYLELRSAWDTNVQKLDDAQVTAISEACRRHSVEVSCIGSPIGKSPITDPLETELANLDRIFQIAEALGTDKVRLFSFYPPEQAGDGGADQYLDEAVSRLSRMARDAEQRGITLLMENESGLVGDGPERCLAILKAVDSPSLRFVWDTANFVHAGFERPTDNAWPLLSSYLVYVQVKDYRMSDQTMYPAGEGDGQVPELLAKLRDNAYRGFLALEPHLVTAGQRGGFSGTDGMRRAVSALRGLMADAGCVEVKTSPS